MPAFNYYPALVSTMMKLQKMPLRTQTRPIGDVPRRDHECEDDPDVYGEEGMIVEKSAGLSDDGNDHPYVQSEV
jgi:hypothetical protein